MPADKKAVAKLKKIKAEDRHEDHWAAMHDARTLMNAQIISNDEKRLQQARNWAAVLAEDEREEAVAMRAIADA